MATHNAHFVRGLLDTNSERIILVRLDRSSETQSVNVIDKEMFRDIDSDPFVRFSNLLEAIFFPISIVCENEADCLFYRNLCRAIDQSTSDNDVSWLRLIPLAPVGSTGGGLDATRAAARSG